VLHLQVPWIVVAFKVILRWFHILILFFPRFLLWSSCFLRYQCKRRVWNHFKWFLCCVSFKSYRQYHLLLVFIPFIFLWCFKSYRTHISNKLHLYLIPSSILIFQSHLTNISLNIYLILIGILYNNKDLHLIIAFMQL
jgi:hypothetical protein